MNQHTVMSCANWALTVVKMATTLVATKLLGMVILSVLVKTWSALAVMLGVC
ncbi:hypothetical protein [Aeromonas hydrophila]|uniref:hypothetical protein n=1 Tax=Aeromonas hydrophila TaxID=644 RepID=UPI002B485928|nr:hypothetical protein [Aeromonas hydrophila]